MKIATTADVSANVRQIVALLPILASELRDHNDAIGELDICRIEEQLARENAICSEMMLLLREIDEFRAGLNPQLRENAGALKWVEVVPDIGQRIEAVKKELQEATRTHAAVARRACRSIRVLRNVILTGLEPYSEALPSVHTEGVFFRH